MQRPDLGRRLAQFMARRAVGADKHELARAFGLTFMEVDALLDVHGDPPKVLGGRLPRDGEGAPGSFAAATAPRD